jgi:hypothetical protein
LDEGKFQYLVKWVPEITEEYKSDDTVEIVNRLDELDDGNDEVEP